MADVTTENHRPVPGRVPVVRPVRPVRPARPEPSWARVLLTTVELWASRRLRHPAFLRRLVLAMVTVTVVAVAGCLCAGGHGAGLVAVASRVAASGLVNGRQLLPRRSS